MPSATSRSKLIGVGWMTPEPQNGYVRTCPGDAYRPRSGPYVRTLTINGLNFVAAKSLWGVFVGENRHPDLATVSGHRRARVVPFRRLSAGNWCPGCHSNPPTRALTTHGPKPYELYDPHVVRPRSASCRHVGGSRLCPVALCSDLGGTCFTSGGALRCRGNGRHRRPFSTRPLAAT